jgi:hypothetical protein
LVGRILQIILRVVKRPIIFLIVSMICSYSVAQSDCSKAVRYDDLITKLDSVICVPIGYQIIRIYDDKDLDGDELIDKVVCYKKIKLNDGDTIYYSLYLRRKNNELSLYKKLGNLEPLHFKSYEYRDKTGNKLLDSIKTIYFYPSLTQVDFNNGVVEISLYTEPVALRKLRFTFSPKDGTWILTRETQWYVPPKSYQGDEELDENGRKLEFDRAPEKPTRIEDFDMLRYVER